MFSSYFQLPAALLIAILPFPLFAVTDEEPPVIEGTANANPIAAVDPEEALISAIQFPDDMVARLFAREPDVQDPTAITFDDQNRLYIAETHRFERGVEDNRRLGSRWVTEDYKLTTTAERLEMYKRHQKDVPLSYFTEYSEKIRVLQDTDNDGIADKVNIFADGFNDPLDGTAAGIMALDGKIYFACIPHIWLLEDTDGDLKADTQESLQDGYGISVSLSGHDLNGFALGPDNRIYFTIGDRGYNLKTKEGKTLYSQYGGAAFRMERDGSNLEVFHSGLRNPKEVAFDQFGNLFSVDNNADMGDKARVVDIIEGAHSGWHRGHQAFQKFMNYISGKPRHLIQWMEEGQWELDHPLTPAAILPPSAYVSGGPSGLAYNPGTGLSKKWDNHFFICDYVGANSAVIGFSMKPKGAGFVLDRKENFVSGFLNTDVEFGYDGKVYVTDYVGSWTTHGFGNVFTFENPEALKDPKAAEIKGIFAKGFTDRTAEELATFLRHPDMRVRLRTQFAITNLPNGRDILHAATATSEPITTRLHGVWGLGNLARLKTDSKAAELLIALTADKNAKVRGQSIKAIGQANYKKGASAAISLLTDTDPRTQMHAAIALGRIGTSADYKALFALLRENNDADFYLRHGAVQGLVQIGDADTILEFSTDKSAAVRRGIVLALRRMHDPRIAQFLGDADLSVAVEVAQAINDEYIEGARAQLAAATHLLGKKTWLVDLRILNSMYRAGGSENITRLLAAASNENLLIDARAEAIFLLNRWDKKIAVDLTTGKYRPISGERSLIAAKDEINRTILPLLTSGSGDLLVECLNLAAITELEIPIESLIAQVRDSSVPTNVRSAALKKLEKDQKEKLIALLPELAKDKQIDFKKLVFKKLKQYDLALSVDLAIESLKNGEIPEKQLMLRFLSELKDSKTEKTLIAEINAINERPKGVQLDIILAVEKIDTPAAKEALKTYNDSLDSSDPLAAFQVALEGGNRRAGRLLFYKNGQANCVQCHKIGSRGGDAGPNLRGLPKRHTKEYMLESIVAPSAQPAIGYSPISINLKNGETVSGKLMAKSETEVVLADIKTEVETTYLVSDISSFPPYFSTMPPMGLILNKTQIRDLVEFLSLIGK